MANNFFKVKRGLIVGNTSVNSELTEQHLKLNNTLQINSTSIDVGNTSVNTSVISVGANLAINSTVVSVGNSSSNVVLSRTGLLFSNSVAGFNSLKLSANTTYSGVVELATPTEANTGTSSSLVVTPEGLSTFMNNFIKIHKITYYANDITVSTTSQTGSVVHSTFSTTRTNANTSLFVLMGANIRGFTTSGSINSFTECNCSSAIAYFNGTDWVRTISVCQGYLKGRAGGTFATFMIMNQSYIRSDTGTQWSLRPWLRCDDSSMQADLFRTEFLVVEFE